jgi:alpha-1,3-glucosyltransferase
MKCADLILLGQGRPLLCAFLFSTLLNFKHIYIYIAPAYFIFLLQSYVVKGSGSSSLHSGPAERLFTLGITTLTPFALSVIPLALSGFSGNSPASPVGILSQMLSRLFPFSRGLNHAYWAANIWSLYTFADRVLVKLLPATPIDDLSATASRGIIGDTRFTFLPQIAAGHCFILTTIFTAIFSIRLFIKPTQTSFLQAITLFGLTSFLFGFHVHEKAILLALIPLTLLAPLDYFYVRMTLLLSTSGIIALFPLLFQVKETPIKYIYSILWSLVTFRAMFAFHFRPTPSNWDLLLSYLENIYLVGFVPLQVFVSVVHPLYMAGNLNPLVEKAAAAVTASTSATEAVASVVSASASQASASISVLAAGISMGPQFNDTLSPSTFSDLLTSAGEAVSSNGKAAQDIVATAIESIVEVAKGAVSAKPSEAPSTAMEFLPLMLTSVYCALGVTFVWIRLGYRFLTIDEEALNQTHIKVTSSTPSRKAR